MLYANTPTGLNQFLTSMQVQYQDKFSAWYQDLGWDTAWGIAGNIGEAFIGITHTPSAPSIQMPSYVLFPNALDWQILGLLMDPIKLRKGESVTKSCAIGILNDPNNPVTWFRRSEDSIIINAHLKYRYFIDEPIALTVTAPIVRVPTGA
jgi:hypothetical protein